MRKISTLSAIIVLLLLLIFGGPLFDKKLSISQSINNLLSIPSSRQEFEDKIASLEAENLKLRKQILSKDGIDSVSAKVYSSYPLNNRSEIAISAGKKNGIEVGDTVVYGDNVLVGKITNVFKSSSIVTTIFDPSWEISVRIGDNEVDALLSGGNELTLTLIPKEIEIKPGEKVVSAGSNIPYGLKIGIVRSVSDIPGGVFKKAIVEPDFQIRQLRDVAIYH